MRDARSRRPSARPVDLARHLDRAVGRAAVRVADHVGHRLVDAQPRSRRGRCVEAVATRRAPRPPCGPVARLAGSEVIFNRMTPASCRRLRRFADDFDMPSCQVIRPRTPSASARLPIRASHACHFSSRRALARASVDIPVTERLARQALEPFDRVKPHGRVVALQVFDQLPGRRSCRGAEPTP